MSATFKRSPASSCSRESIGSYRHPNAFDGVEFIRQNARTVESASAKGYCLSSQTTIESRHSQQKRSLPGHLPKPFCKQFQPEKIQNQGNLGNILEGILQRVEEFRELDKDKVKDRLRDMTSIFSGKEGSLVFDFIEEENKVVLKYLIYILYDTLFKNFQSFEKPQISQQFLEEELAQKRRQLQDLSDKLGSCSQKFNAMRDILEESRKGYEGLVAAMVQGGSEGEESVRRAKSKIRQLQNEFKKINELDKPGISRSSISKSLPMKDIGNILTQDRYQGIASQKELSKERLNDRGSFSSSSSSSIDGNNTRYKRKFDGLKNELGKLENEYENLGQASLTLAEQADRHRKCLDKQLKLCRKLEEQNEQLEQENIMLFEENTDLREKNIAGSMRQTQKERGIVSKHGSQDCLSQENKLIGNNFEKRIKLLEQLNQELQQNYDVIQHEKQELKKRDAYFMEIRELLEEKIKELTNLNDGLEHRIVELEKQLADKQEDNVDLNRELTECLALVEAGKVSIDQLKMTMKDKQTEKDGDEITRAEKITQRIIHNIQQEQRIIASKLLQSSDQAEELEDQDEIKSLFGEEMLEFLNKMQLTIKNKKNVCQSLQQQIHNHVNSRIQANQDIIVLASIVLQTYQVLASHSHLPALLEQLQQQLFEQKQSITDKIQETEDDTQNMIQQMNKSNPSQQFQESQPMDSSRDNELLQVFETQNVITNYNVKNNGSSNNSRNCSPRNSTLHQSYNGINNNSINYSSQRSNCIPRPSISDNQRRMTLNQQQNCFNRKNKQCKKKRK